MNDEIATVNMEAEPVTALHYGDVGVSVVMEDLQALMDRQRSGTIFCIREYVDKQLVTANHWLQHDINYGRVRQKSIDMLRGMIENGIDPLTVKSGTRLDCNGNMHTMPGKDVKLDADNNPVIDPETGKPLKIARTNTPMVLELDGTDQRVKDAADTLLYELEHPKPPRKVYNSTGKGGATAEVDGEICFYIRDCLTVGRQHVEGEYKFNASSPAIAIKDALRKTLPVGRYRQFKLTYKQDGRSYEYGDWGCITMGGQAVLCDGVENKIFFALPEHAKAAM